MMFPLITTPEAPLNDTPALEFPEITLPAPAAVPPIVLLVAVDVLIETPTSLPRSFPLVLVPIRFPKTTFPVVPDPVITIPEPVPPMAFLCAGSRTPDYVVRAADVQINPASADLTGCDVHS